MLSLPLEDSIAAFPYIIVSGDIFEDIFEDILEPYVRERVPAKRTRPVWLLAAAVAADC
jgi:hypothetical protein